VRRAIGKDPVIMLAAAVVIVLLLAAVLAPWIAPASPSAQQLAKRLTPPGGGNWLGTDELGRDILSRVIYGARVSMTVSVGVVFAAGALGLAVGTIAAYFGGLTDRLINVVAINTFLAFPGILLAIALAASLGPGTGKVILALTVTGWAGYARLARAQVAKVRELEYVQAARSLGAPGWRIWWAHLLPNIIPPLLVQATVGLAAAILAESTLSFLGLGVLQPTPSWGSMLNDARNHLFDAPHLVVSPAVAIMLAVFSFNLLGDALRDWVDPQTKRALGG
jgi:peptide/nickel transport system permease protein